MTTAADPDIRLPSSQFSHDEKSRRRKKRSKLMRIDDMMASSSSGVVSKPKLGIRKPDPTAPKITRPCSECGKKFWSWKALFGHMRCHPERQWRGINPPQNLRRPVSPSPSPANAASDLEGLMSDDDHEVAACLLMLANGGNASIVGYHHDGVDQVFDGFVRVAVEEAGASETSCRFECSSCKKVFGSHQALGGHRASHKNVKGCFAINRSDGDQAEEDGHNGSGGGDERDSVEDKVLMVLGTGHKCSICLRVFSTGQALGGHKRCHWEKGEGFSGLDLNLPAPMEDGSSSSYSSSGLTLDLRLGL
ncbi:zinc finger protein ZAT3-like [Alnus glutinosa]|uniref:zinc finger protein ZAT3-like n=1 Tax=Alnus glutinosa TaxID=3517 RepID=UPI002D787AB3|nr:zinc finger protein ZAT3-like [Alnus glutinosa]